MTKYLVAIYRPHDYDRSIHTDKMMQEIDALNDEMEAAGVRIAAYGLRPTTEARSLRSQANGEVAVTEGPFLGGGEFVDGFWVLTASTLEEALEWGRKAIKACQASVEVRPFY